MKFIIAILFISGACLTFGQKKTYNTTIEKANRVFINNNTSVDTQIVNNPINYNKPLLYLLNMRDLTPYKKDSLGKLHSDFYVEEYTFGNPDSVEVRDVNISMTFNEAIDTGYFEVISPTKQGPFATNISRDVWRTISPDKKSINFKASYIGRLVKVKLVLLRGLENKTLKISGVGKLF